MNIIVTIKIKNVPPSVIDYMTRRDQATLALAKGFEAAAIEDVSVTLAREVGS